MSTGTTSQREAALEDQQFNPAKLFIGGLGPRTTGASLRDYFGRFGAIKDAAVVEDRLTGRSRGFGFVVFEKDEDADTCVAQSRHKVDGVSCEIRRAVPRDDARTAADQGNRCKVYVGGLKEEVTESLLRSYFQKYGAVDEVQVMLDRNTHRPRGFAFVLFKSPVDAERSFGSHPELGASAEAKIAEPRSVTRRFQQQQQQQQQQTSKSVVYGGATVVPAGPTASYTARVPHTMESTLFPTGNGSYFFGTYQTPAHPSTRLAASGASEIPWALNAYGGRGRYNHSTIYSAGGVDYAPYYVPTQQSAEGSTSVGQTAETTYTGVTLLRAQHRLSGSGRRFSPY